MTSLSETSMLAGASGAPSRFTIDQSIRFDKSDDTYLSKTFGSPTAAKKFTISTWVKLPAFTDEARGAGRIMDVGGSAGSDTLIAIGSGYDGYEQIQFWQRTSSSYNFRIETNARFRDPSAWYHLVFNYDSDNDIPEERIKIYINGSRDTDLAQNTFPSDGYVSRINANSAEHRIGKTVYSSTNIANQLLAEYHFSDGYLYGPESFGEFKENTDIWTPIEVDITYGNNGFYLKGQNSSSLGNDSSGNGNNFSSNGLAAHDQLTDTPTNNFAVLNPIDEGNRLSTIIGQGNLELKGDIGSNQYRYGRATFDFDITDTDGWYWEVLEVVTGSNICGITQQLSVLSGNNLAFTGAKGVTARGGGGGNTYWQNQDTNYTSVDYGVSTGAGKIISFCAKNGKLFIAVNNTYVQSGNPATEANPQYSSLTGRWAPYVGLYDSTSTNYHTITNFGQDGTFAGNKTAQGNTDASGFGNFFYSPPAGAKALCSRNNP